MDRIRFAGGGLAKVIRVDVCFSATFSPAFLFLGIPPFYDAADHSRWAECC